MARWLTSDLHFGHFNIMAKYCRETRPFDTLDEMHAQLIARWNEVVTVDDEVIVVGDMIASRKIDRHLVVGMLKMLNGNKTLVRGNHDPGDDIFMEAGFLSCEDHLWLPEERVLIIHKPPDPQHGAAELRIARALQPALVVHGHDHRHDTPEDSKCLNVCVDRWGLRPVPWSQVEARKVAAGAEVGKWAMPT